MTELYLIFLRVSYTFQSIDVSSSSISLLTKTTLAGKETASTQVEPASYLYRSPLACPRKEFSCCQWQRGTVVGRHLAAVILKKSHFLCS